MHMRRLIMSHAGRSWRGALTTVNAKSILTQHAAVTCTVRRITGIIIVSPKGMNR